MPSLKQLNEAVLAYADDHPDHTITVVVDATFGHRIDPREVGEFDEAIEHNELVAPPAGAIGRGDAFVLMIAKKANAVILSNDSFQEFHGDHPWLFDEGRLVGGKPVPHVGWVYVARSPVRGAISRRAVKATKTGERAPRRARAPRAADLANQPMPAPKMPPPAAKRSAQPAQAPAAPQPEVIVAAPSPARTVTVNDVLAFLEFVEKHPVGSTIDATIESYASHGAYADCGGVKVYAPLRLMGEPAPRSAREVLKLGDVRSFIVASFNAARRSIDIALSGGTAAETPAAVDVAPKPTRAKTPRKKAAAPVVEAPPAPEIVAPVPANRLKKAAAGRSSASAKPVVEPTAEPVAVGVPAKKARAKKAPVAQAPAPPTKAPAPPTKAPAKRPAKVAAPVPAESVAPVPIEAAPVKKAAVRKAPAKKATKASTPSTPSPPSPAPARAKKAAAPVNKAAAPVKKAAAPRKK